MRRHEKCKAHVTNVGAATTSTRLSDLGFVPVGSAIDMQVVGSSYLHYNVGVSYF